MESRSAGWRLDMQFELFIVAAGQCCTIQDRGRLGCLRDGVANSGPMDWVAFKLAQKLAGVSPNQPGLEVSVGGIELEVGGGELRVGLAGVGFVAAVNGRLVSYPSSIRLRPGERLSIRAGKTGSWFYVIPAAIMNLSPVLGSFATHARYGIGPGASRMLRAGDRINLSENDNPILEYETKFPDLAKNDPIRVILGPQDDHFDPMDVETFLSSAFEVTSRNDRMAYILSGPRIPPETSYDIVTDGTALGSIQIAGDGSPYVLMADRSSTGGYPKIATIIRADVGRFAQHRAGDSVHFRQTNIETAVSELRELQAKIDAVTAGQQSSVLNLEALGQGDGAAGVCDALAF